jgi:hypothetical protein
MRRQTFPIGMFTYHQIRGAGFRAWQQNLAALSFFIIVTTTMLYPVVLNFSKLPAGGDIYEYIWKLWWFKHALIETGQSPWIAPHIYYPHGYLLSYGETTPLNTILGLPLTWLLGEYRAFNTLLLLSTILSGFTTFLLVREITDSVWAGLLAGIIFAFAPYRRVRFLHLNLLSTQWLPLIFYFLERFVRTRKPKYALGGGIAFGLNALASWYYAVAAGVLTLAWGIVRLFSHRDVVRGKEIRSASLWEWQGLVLFVVAAGILIVPFVIPYLAVANDPDTAIPLENTNFYSASLSDYLIPTPFHPLWGDLVRGHLLPHLEKGEFIIGWGFVAWLFGLYALRWGDREVIRPWLYVTLVALILSLGLTLHIAGRQVVIPAPDNVVATVNRILNTISLNFSLTHEPFTIGRAKGLVIPMPALFLRWFVPVVGKLRTWARFGQMALFGVAVLAGLGATTWHRREVEPQSSLNRQRMAWAIVLGVALFELWWAPVKMQNPITPRPVDLWLADQGGHRAIIEYPLASAFTSRQFIYTRFHGRPIVHGYATYFTFLFSRRHPELLDFPSQAGLAQLSEWDVQYVLIETAPPYTQQARASLTQIEQEPCLRKVNTQDSIEVYELEGCDQFPRFDCE